MIDVTFSINGTDYSGLLSTYNVTHEIEVRETVTTLDGTEYSASFRRPIVSFSLMPLNDEQTAELYSYLSAITVEATYTDPHLGREAVAVMRVTSNLESEFGIKSVDGNRYYKGGEITLRQITVL